MPYRKMKNSQRNCLTSSNMATAWHHLTCSTVARKGLEEHRSASIRNSETPQQDKPCQNSPPYRTGMEWRPETSKARLLWHAPPGTTGSADYAKTMYRSCGWSCNGSFGGSSGLRSARSRNSPTPAGFKPNLSKNQPPKNYLTSPSDAHKKDEERPTPMPDITRQAASKAWKNRAKTM